VQNDVNASLESTALVDCLPSPGCSWKDGFDLKGVHIDTTDSLESAGSFSCSSSVVITTLFSL